MIPILVSILVVVMFVGPLMMLKPTKKQKKQAKLRSLALNYGLVVSGGITLNDGRYVARYILPYESDSIARKLNFELQRQNFSHGAHYDGEWDWKNDAETWPFDHGVFKTLLADARTDYYSIGASRMGVYVIWGERLKGQSEGEAVESVHTFLNKFMILINDQVAAGLSVTVAED